MITAQTPPAADKAKPIGSLLGGLNFVCKYWLVIFIFGSVLLFAFATVLLAEKANGEYPLTNIVYFIDRNDSRDFDKILAIDDDQWQATQTLKFEKSKAKIWLKLRLPEHTEQLLFLRFKNPLLDKVEIKVVDNTLGGELVAEFEMGDTTSFNSRTIKLPNFVVPLKLNHSDMTVYLSAKSELSVDLGFGLWSERGFLTFNDHTTIFFGLVFGYILALICYSLMMYATVQKAEYMWYVLYLASFLLHAMVLSGFGFQYLWPQSIDFQTVIGGISISLTYACLIKFTQIITRPTLPAHNRLFSASVNTHFALCALSIVTLNPIFLNLHLIAIIITAIIVPILCAMVSRTGSVIAQVFILIWTVFLFVSIVAVFSMSEISILPIEHIYILLIAFQIQSMMIGAILIYAYKVSYKQTLKMKEHALQEKEKTVRAKDQIFQLEQDAQQKLEQQVKAQTVKLEGALDKLSLTSSELTHIRNVDGLTGLPNRLAFDNSFAHISKLSIELGVNLNVAVLDIDHFKQINDRHGHLAGDDCLRKFSKLLHETFAGDDYVYCRFGGEEFIITSILPYTQVLKKLEWFRSAVEALTISFAGQIISLTVSTGVVSRRLKDSSECTSLLSTADENLYLAKHKGRNVVVS